MKNMLYKEQASNGTYEIEIVVTVTVIAIQWITNV